MKYEFSIEYCAEGNNPAEVMLKCQFDAPDEETADQLFDAICREHDAMIHVQHKRPYQHVREWKRKG